MPQTSNSTITSQAAEDRADVQLRGIRKSFGGVEVLHGVDLDLRRGSTLALLGENGAGKSTLVKILAGDYAPDAGEIVIDGRSYAALDPARAKDLGIRMIFQELTDAPSLSVAENIFLGRLPSRHSIVRWRSMRERAARTLAELGVRLDLDAPAESLTIGERQTVEIARAISGQARVLILDEPTAALSGNETSRLFELLARLRARGTALVYITHRLDEVAVVGDLVQVLRDGEVVLRTEVENASRDDLVTAMVGHALHRRDRSAAVTKTEERSPALRFEHATSAGLFEDVDLELLPGEIVALYGKVGSGNGAVAEAAYGLRPLSSGRVTVGERKHAIKGPWDAIANRIGLLAADRQREGAFQNLSVAQNLAAPSWRRLARRGFFITAGDEARAYRRWHEALRVRSRNDPGQPIGTLSGGNQQKVLLGRWFESNAKVLLLIEPTRGVDVGAREDIYRSVRALADGGAAILVASSDHEEVEQIADRAAVMARRHIVAWFAGTEITTPALIAAAGG